MKKQSKVIAKRLAHAFFEEGRCKFCGRELAEPCENEGRCPVCMAEIKANMARTRSEAPCRGCGKKITARRVIYCHRCGKQTGYCDECNRPKLCDHHYKKYIRFVEEWRRDFAR